MSAATPPVVRPSAWWRRRIEGMTLRGRLLAVTIALLALICGIVGVVTVFVLRQNLVQQVDDRLRGPAARAFGGQGDPNGHPGGAPGPGAPTGPSDPTDILRQPGGGEGLLLVRIVGDTVTGSYVVDGGTAPTTTAQNAVLATVPTDGQATSRDVPGLGHYRLIANAAPDRSVVVTGLPLADVDSTLLHLALTELFVALAGMIGVGLIGETVIRRTLRPLRRVAATASRVSDLKLDQGEVALSVRVPERDTDPRTEVGQVGASLNRMLGHVATALAARQASETRVRQFVADASHELRTPLAAIRGYAELTRRVDGDVPDDVRYAMTRVESESARMTALVEDLLLLARLDSGRPLDAEPVDLTRLAIDAVSDAHVAGPDHTWALSLPDEPVEIRGDAPRLHQVLVNLLANARAHTPPGTKVEVALEPTAGGGALMRVSDDGPGIPPALLPDVFDRFARGDTSRSRAAGSTGLGLAIVAAVVDSHGGSVDVSSVPGRTEFAVTLAAHPPATD